MMDNNNLQPQQPIPPRPSVPPQPPVFQPQFQPQPVVLRRKLPIKLIIIVAAAVLVLGGIIGTILVILSSSQHSKFETSVKSALVSVATTYSQTKKKGDGYSVEIPASATSADVILQGGGSVDGMTYCVTGTSTKDKTVAYFVSSQSQTPQKGSCTNAGDTITLSSTGMPSIATTTTDTIKLSWNTVPGAKKYTLQCSTVKDFSKDITEVTSTESSAQCTGLKDGTDYYIRVQAQSTSQGPWSDIAQASTNSLSIAPTGLKLTATSGSISYSWQPVTGATSYVVEWATDVNFVKNKGRTITTTTSGVTSGLLANTVYWYHVKAITASEDESHAAFSAEVQVTTAR